MKKHPLAAVTANRRWLWRLDLRLYDRCFHFFAVVAAVTRLKNS
jgi:hypothetical protein